MIVIALVVLALVVAVFIMLTDTRKNNNFAALSKTDVPPADDPKG
ncbi:hypothetical protein [Sandarakinorhabdus sp.]